MIFPHVSKIIFSYNNNLGGCSRRKPIRKNHPLQFVGLSLEPPEGVGLRVP